jgi:hypothetical protein
MGTRSRLLPLAALALTTFGVARAEMGFEAFEGHWRRSSSGGPSTFVIPLAVDKMGIYHSAVRMVRVLYKLSVANRTLLRPLVGTICARWICF